MRLLLTLSILLGAMTLFAQSTLTATIDELAKAMQEVPGIKASYAQSLHGNAGKPYAVTFRRVTSNEKGKSSEESWSLNLADIDPRSVRVEDSKEALRVYLKVNKGQKYIQHFEGSQLSGYVDQLAILGRDIDNARAIERLLLSAISQAVEAWNKVADIEGKSNEQLLQRLMSTVGEVTLGNTTFRQKLEPAGDFPDRLRLTVETTTAKGSDQQRFIWSFGDLKESGVRLVISGANAAVEAATTDGLGWVYAESAGVPEDFSKEVSIRVADPDQGKIISAILEKLIPYGKEQIKMRLPSANGATEAFQLVADAMGKIPQKNGDLEFTLAKNCQSKLTERNSAQGDASEMAYAFHFGDLDPKTVRLAMVRDRVEIRVSTENRSSFIWTSKAGEQQNYDNELVFRLPDVEKGRAVAHLLPTLIDQCPETLTLGGFEEVQNWLSKGARADVGEAQYLNFQSDDESCKWKLLQTVTGDKKSSEYSYEFNAYDIDPEQVKIIVNKKTVSVQLQTLKKENIISSISNEKPGFTSTLQMDVADVIAAKSVKASLEQLLKNCRINVQD